jgi:hypothetical protein
LARKDGIESVNLLLGPFHACTHEKRREASLESRDRVSYNCEVHKGHSPNILTDVAFKDALPGIISTSLSGSEEDLPRSLVYDISACFQVSLSRSVLKTQTCQPVHITLSFLDLIMGIN